MPRLLRIITAAALGLAAAATALLPPKREPAEGPMPPAAHEPRDVGFRAMLVAGVLLLAGLGGMMGLAAWMYPRSVQDREVSLPLPRFPEPQLQPATAVDMAAFHARQLRQVDTAYWTDRAAGRLHLPIHQAMQDVAKRGIPDWPTK